MGRGGHGDTQDRDRLMSKRKANQPTARARSLRDSETKSERLLWSILRGKQLSNLKFRRQHPIGPFFADFACVSKRLVVEIDGGYHDAIGQSDLDRQAYLQHHGWEVMRVADEEVEKDAEAVARGIAKQLGMSYEFTKRLATGSGTENVNAPQKRQT